MSFLKFLMSLIPKNYILSWISRPGSVSCHLLSNICYGWLGNKAVLVCDKDPVKDREMYKIFLEKLREETDLSGEDLEKKEKDLLTILSMAAFALVVPFGIFAVGTKLVKDYFYNENQLKKQQYIYGIFHLYKHHLKEFMDI